MPSREEKLRYLSHHVSYELLMPRYTYARLHDTSHKLTLSKDRLRMARHGILSWLTPTITSQTRLCLTRAPIPLPIRSQFRSSMLSAFTSKNS